MEIVDLDESFLDFVSLRTHIDKTMPDCLRAAKIRKRWLLDRSKKGLKVKVAMDKGKPVGFVHCLPIEMDSWGMSGNDLMTVPCLTLNYRLGYDKKSARGMEGL